MPSSLHAQITRSAISPRFAMRIFLNMNLLSALSRQLSASARQVLAKTLNWNPFPLNEMAENWSAEWRRSGATERSTDLIFSPERRTTADHIQSVDRYFPFFSRFRRPHPTQSRSATSSPRRCKALAPLLPYHPPLRTAVRRAKAPHRRFPRSEKLLYADFLLLQVRSPPQAAPMLELPR